MKGFTLTFDCWFSQGLPGKDGLDGLPGNDGAMVSRTSLLLLFLPTVEFFIARQTQYIFLEYFLRKRAVVFVQGPRGERGADGFPGKPGLKVLWFHTCTTLRPVNTWAVTVSLLLSPGGWRSSWTQRTVRRKSKFHTAILFAVLFYCSISRVFYDEDTCRL